MAMASDERRISARRQAAKNKLRKSSARSEKALQELGALYNEEKPIEEWDWEELQRGRPKNKNGKFTGVQPRWITPAVHEEAARRLRSLSVNKLGEHTQAAIDVMVRLMTKSKVDMVRFQAAKYVLDQIMGIPTAKVEVQGNINVRNFLADLLVNMDGRPAVQDAIDAEIVDDDEDDEDEDDEDYDDE